MTIENTVFTDRRRQLHYTVRLLTRQAQLRIMEFLDGQHVHMLVNACGFPTPETVSHLQLRLLSGISSLLARLTTSSDLIWERLRGQSTVRRCAVDDLFEF